MNDASPTDPAADELRRLLRDDELVVDPSQRERAIGAALAVADGLGITATAISPPTEPDPDTTHRDGVVTPLRREPARRLRLVASIAAGVLVVAGIAGVLVDPGSRSTSDSSSSEESADLETLTSDTAASDSAGASQADSAEGLSAPNSPTSTVAAPPDVAAAARAPGEFELSPATGLFDLGEVADLQTLIDSTRAIPALDAPTTGVAGGSAGFCATVLASSDAVAVAVARVAGAGADVVVARSTAAGTEGVVLVLSTPGCTLLASG